MQYHKIGSICACPKTENSLERMHVIYIYCQITSPVRHVFTLQQHVLYTVTGYGINNSTEPATLQYRCIYRTIRQNNLSNIHSHITSKCTCFINCPEYIKIIMHNWILFRSINNPRWSENIDRRHVEVIK